MIDPMKEFAVSFNNQNSIKKLEADSKYYADREAYIRGKKDSSMELPRGGDVLYKTQREIDCYNMGYSYGE